MGACLLRRALELEGRCWSGPGGGGLLSTVGDVKGGSGREWTSDCFFVVCLVKNFQCALAKKRDAEKKKSR